MSPLYATLTKYLDVYGFGTYSAKQLAQKIETSLFRPAFNACQLCTVDWFRSRLKINMQDYRTRLVVNVFLLHLLTTYRGWRHSRGLPVRGQRTWSNGWSSYRSNLTLRSFKIKVAKHLYGGHVSNEYVTAYLAEEVNNMWRLQWGSEWREAKKKRLAVQKNAHVQPKIDLAAMAKINLGVVSEHSKNQTKAKQRKKGSFTLGFDPGFTKNLLTKTQSKNYICL